MSGADIKLQDGFAISSAVMRGLTRKRVAKERLRLIVAVQSIEEAGISDGTRMIDSKAPKCTPQLGSNTAPVTGNVRIRRGVPGTIVGASTARNSNSLKQSTTCPRVGEGLSLDSLPFAEETSIYDACFASNRFLHLPHIG